MSLTEVVKSKGSFGVSPVIGVVLMVAVTVALVTLVTVIGFNIGEDTSEPPQATVDITETSTGVQVTVLRNENTERFIVSGPNTRDVNLSGDPGSSATIGDGTGSYKVISVTEDGGRNVLDSINVGENSPASNARTSSFNQTGTVETNPKVEGATVKSIEDGVVIDTDKTDSEGNYSVGASKDSEIFVSVDGFDSPEISAPLYATARKQSNSDGTIKFNFSSPESVSVGGQTILVDYKSPSGKVQIGNVEQLQAIDKIPNGLSQDYKLISDINATKTANWNSNNGFEPIGGNTPFKGSFNGNNKTISSIKIDRSSGREIGVFGFIENSTIKNLKLDNTSVKGDQKVGSVVGLAKNSRLENIASRNGNIEGTDDLLGNTGGVVGRLLGSNITNIESSGITVTGVVVVGGIVGGTDDTAYSGRSNITNVASSNKVVGEDSVGGAVGGIASTSVTNSYSTGEVRAFGSVVRGIDHSAGGFIGAVGQFSQIENSYATGDVEGEDSIGGFVGTMDSKSTISEAYSTGDVTGNTRVGGFAGTNGGDVLNVYAFSDVTGNKQVGGLVGWQDGYADPSSIQNSYFNGTVSGSTKLGSIIGVSGDVFDTGCEETRVENNYYNSDFSSIDAIGSLGETPSCNIIVTSDYTTSEMSGSSASTNMDGLNFASEWDTVVSPDDYPILSDLDQTVQIQNR
jgi:FlaG/FlaF family flagellin (archaellin)